MNDYTRPVVGSRRIKNTALLYSIFRFVLCSLKSSSCAFVSVSNCICASPSGIQHSSVVLPANRRIDPKNQTCASASLEAPVTSPRCSLPLRQLSLLLVIMGCACCKQKKSAKAVVTLSTAADVSDLSPSNLDGGLSTALTQGRYCPDPTQTIPDFNKGFSSSAIFSNTHTHQRPGVITSRNGSIAC